MFEGFAHVWTPVDLARRLRTRPLAVEVAGERLVLFRDAAGAAHGLLDRCPHRGVALSGGKVCADGTLECPFHGWRFDGGGACAHVPLNPDAKRERLFATPVPVREVGGLLWVFTAPGARALGEPEPSEALVDPAFHRSYVLEDWRCHWTRAMENMLDMPHVPWVHRRTIGRGLRKRLTERSKMDVALTDHAYGFEIRSTVDGTDGGGWLEFRRPNAMVLHLDFIPGRRMRMHVFCVPLSAERTRMIVVGTRDFGHYNPLMKLFDQFNRVIVREDRAVVESSQPPEVPDPALEKSVATDRATLRFRRYYLEALKPSAARAPGAPPLHAVAHEAH